MAWKGDSRRHGLARKGVKTSRKKTHGQPNKTREDKIIDMARDSYETIEKLDAFLETPEGEEYMEIYFGDLYEVPYNAISEEEGIPYWIDNYEDYVYFDTFNKVKYTSSEGDEIIENVAGYHEPYKAGNVRTIRGKEYYYVSGLSGSEEIELQADDGNLTYYNIGSNYYRIWKPLPETYLYLQEDGDFSLMHKGKKVAEGKSHHDLIKKANKNKWELADIMFVEEENRFEMYPES